MAKQKHTARSATPALDEFDDDVEEGFRTPLDDAADDDDEAGGWMTQRDNDDLWDSSDDDDEDEAIAGAPFAEPEGGIPAAAREIQILHVARALVHPDPAQPRQVIDDELRASIARHGILQPLTVRPHPERLTEWMIVDGGRRYAASEGVLDTLPVIPRADLTEMQRTLTQLVANTAKALPPIDEAHAFRAILERSGGTVAELADALGRSRSTVQDRLVLLELGPWTALIASGELPVSHAVRVLAPLRTVPEEYHRQALATIEKDYRFTRNAKGEANGISLNDFASLVRQAYERFMYPLTKSSGYASKNPEFNTAKHDAECSCGGIKFEQHGTARRCCGNPDWWRPLHKKALAAKKAKESSGKAKGSAAPKSKIVLPDAVPTVRLDRYASTPKGVTLLTDVAGLWDVHQHHDASGKSIDPRAFVVDETKLVRVVRGDDVLVGTKDASAVKAARAAFEAEVARQTEAKRAAVKAEIATAMQTHAVTGPGAAPLLAYITAEGAADTDDALVLIAEVAGIPVPKGIDTLEPWKQRPVIKKWVEGLSAADAAPLLAGLAALAALKIDELPDECDVARHVGEQLRKQPSPWHPSRAPKPAKAKAAPNDTPAPKEKASKKKARSSLTARYVADADLAKVVGAEPQLRTDVTKKLWAHIKKHGLQDAKERRLINADSLLRPVFGKAQVTMFEMTKVVHAHLTPAK